MKLHLTYRTIAFPALLSVIFLTQSLALFAQGTAFTYQGWLNRSGAATSGSFDLRFALYDAASNGGQQGATLTNTATAVSNGYFTVTLDFGSQFPSANRWLEVAVRTNGVGAYAVLSPRQPLTPTPYAIRAISAGTAATAATATNVVASGIIGASIATNVVDSSKITDGTITAIDLSGTLLSNTFWRLLGNANTTQGVHFLGTADERIMELRANNTPALRLSRINTTAVPNLIGGFSGNSVAGGSQGAVIGGGGGVGVTNRILSGNATTISGGSGNTVAGEGSIISGGVNNQVLDTYGGIASGLNNSVLKNDSFIGGGLANSVSGDRGVIAGGRDNVIWTNASNAAIGGGRGNIVTGPQGTVPGGFSNTATNNAFAAGTRAKANHQGSFVWADSQNSDFASASNNQFLIRASGGVGIGTTSPGSSLEVIGGIRARGGAPGSGGISNNGYAFSSGGDNDSGLFSSADGQLEFYGNSAERMRIASSGNIGIGKPDPATALDVNGTVTASQFNGPLNGSLSGTFSGGVSASSLKLGNSSTVGSVLTASDAIGGAGFNSHLRVLPGALAFDHWNLVGGNNNTLGANVSGSVIAGGGSFISPNQVTASFGTVAGGAGNVVAGDYGFAAGRRAKANHQGSFVWADSQNSDFASTANNQFLIRAAGGVGINTPSPTPGFSLDVNGDAFTRDSLVIDGDDANAGSLYPGLGFGSDSGEGISSSRTGGDNQYGLDFYTASTRRFSIRLDGGMNLHDNTLGLRGTTDANHGLGFRSTFATHNVDGPALYGYAGGALGTTEGGENWSLRWDKNEVKVKVLTITGGMDLAEPFTMKEEAIEPGSVVVIDDEHPGRLKLSGQAYDTRVAGIVSGAGGVKPGIALHQEGIQEGGQNVALSGRVYVKVDASHGAICPGDLLTTSERPGHAMKVGESGRAQGAILGKAMTALKDGQGLVLVLVTLQ